MITLNLFYFPCLLSDTDLDRFVSERIASRLFYMYTPIYYSLLFTHTLIYIYIYMSTVMGNLHLLYKYICGRDRYALFCRAARNYLDFRAPVYICTRIPNVPIILQCTYRKIHHTVQTLSNLEIRNSRHARENIFSRVGCRLRLRQNYNKYVPRMQECCIIMIIYIKYMVTPGRIPTLTAHIVAYRPRYFYYCLVTCVCV